MTVDTFRTVLNLMKEYPTLTFAQSQASTYEIIEKHAPDILAHERGIDKALCANVDMYSGLVYRALRIPPELFTPIFAVARMAGWCAHRMEELYTCRRIIRPAYKSVMPDQPYIPLDNR